MRVNIIHVGFFYSGGGEKVAIEQARRLRERGHKVKVYSPIIYPDKSYPELLKSLEPVRLVPHLPMPFPFRESSAMLASAVLPFGLGAADCDVLLCHSQPSMWLGYRLSKLYGVPYVGYLHQLTTFIHSRPDIAGNWNTRDFVVLSGLVRVGMPLARYLDRLSHSAASRLLFNSDWTKRLFEEKYGLTGETCHPGIDSHERISPPRVKRVCMVARHYPWKRIDLAFKILAKMESGPTLDVVGGETPFTPAIRRMLQSSSVADRVQIRGRVGMETLNRIYSESRAYMQTSIYEPFGMAPLEAQSYGTPAVVWGDAGARETVLDGETGYHARPYDEEDFASKLDALVTDDALWSRMSSAARDWASKFTWDSHVDRVEGALLDAAK